ncbi:MAG: FMN-binding protein [Gammaproteobacteria bacterium]
MIGHFHSRIILAPVLIRGYKGEIALLVGIRRDGVLLGVRTLRHQETPGLGDGIETRHSDWMLGFAGRSLAAPAGERPQDADGDIPERHWALRAEGGDFDQLSGATGTSRAVVEATKRVLQYHGNHRNRLYDGKRRPGDGWRRRPHSCEDGGRHAGLTPSPRAVMLPSPVKPDPLPLVIDVDGALVSGDLLIEGVARRCRCRS